MVYAFLYIVIYMICEDDYLSVRGEGLGSRPIFNKIKFVSSECRIDDTHFIYMICEDDCLSVSGQY